MLVVELWKRWIAQDQVDAECLETVSSIELQTWSKQGDIVGNRKNSW